MVVKELLEELEQIRQIANRWTATASVCAIERDLVLDKLKSIYGRLLLAPGVSENRGADLVKEVVQSVRIAAENEGGQDRDDSVAAENRVAVVDEAAFGTEETTFAEKEAGFGGEEVTVGGEFGAVCPADLTSEDACIEPAAISDDVSVITEMVVEEFVSQTTVRDEEQIAEQNRRVEEVILDQKLFSDEPQMQSILDKKQVILSLYGDDKPITEHKATTVQATTFRTTQSFRSAENRDTASVPVSDSHLADSAPGTKKVLGEVMSNGNVAFNEMLGKQTNFADVASKLQHAQNVTDLRQCIGINDKFLLIRDLFAGSAFQYDEAIAALNGFTDLDEAMIFIQENYGGNPDSEGLRFLVDLLERKLGY